jgi:hypothetical protein
MSMGYPETWKILEEIVIELRKKGTPASENVMSDLKSAKTLIKLMETGEDRGEIGPKIEQYLSTVEANLVTEAQKTVTPEKIDEWLRRLESSSCEACTGIPKLAAEKEQRFIPGLPRDQKWVRVTPIVSLPKEKLEELAHDSDLSVKAENDGHLVVYGSAEDIRDFVKKMTKETSNYISASR